MTSKTLKKNTIKRLIINYILPYKLSIFFALMMMVISAAATGLHAWLVRPALDEVLIKGNKEMLLLIDSIERKKKKTITARKKHKAPKNAQVRSFINGILR